MLAYHNFTIDVFYPYQSDGYGSQCTSMLHGFSTLNRMYVAHQSSHAASCPWADWSTRVKTFWARPWASKKTTSKKGPSWACVTLGATAVLHCRKATTGSTWWSLSASLRLDSVSGDWFREQAQSSYQISYNVSEQETNWLREKKKRKT